VSRGTMRCRAVSTKPEDLCVGAPWACIFGPHAGVQRCRFPKLVPMINKVRLRLITFNRPLTTIASSSRHVQPSLDYHHVFVASRSTAP
jgi:hypothetical protein